MKKRWLYFSSVLIGVLICSLLVVPAMAAAPVADFEVDNPYQVDSGNFQFTDLSTESPDTYQWEYSDDSGANWHVFSTDQNPYWTDVQEGTYSIRLTATNQAGSDDETKIDYITVYPPITFIDITPNNACNQSFTHVVMAGGNLTPYSYAELSIQNFSVEYGEVYVAATNLTIISDNQIEGDFGFNGITLSPGLKDLVYYFEDNVIFIESGFTVTDCTTPPETPPVASFTTNTTYGAAPLAVQFNDTSSNTPTAWNWSFGDGNYSETQNPEHLYEYAGNFGAYLNASNSAGYNITLNPYWIIVSGTCGTTIHYWKRTS
jgi:PKD repeat protein